MPRLQFRDAEARIAYLAATYYLALPRPSAEVQAMQPLHDTLAANLDHPHAIVEADLTAGQVHRLGEALLGLVNELKQYEMAQGRSAASGFGPAMLRAFPEVVPPAEGGSGEPGAALDLVAEVVVLHRRLDGAIREADAELERQRAEAEAAARAARKPWWKLWSR